MGKIAVDPNIKFIPSGGDVIILGCAYLGKNLVIRGKRLMLQGMRILARLPQYIRESAVFDWLWCGLRTFGRRWAGPASLQIDLCGPQFRRLEPRRVLNASFALAGGQLDLLFQADSNLSISYDASAEQFEFTLSSGSWFDGATDTGSNSLLISDTDLTDLLNVESTFITDVMFLAGDAASLDSVRIDIDGTISDQVGSDYTVSGLLTIVDASSTVLGDDVSDSWDIGSLTFENAGSLSVTVQNDLVVEGSNTASGDVFLASGGDIDIDGSIAIAGNLFLVADGNVAQTAAISGDGLGLMVDGSTLLDDPNNDFDVLAANNVGELTYVDASGFSVGSVTVGSNSVSGVSISGTGEDISLTAAGSIDLDDVEALDGSVLVDAAGNVTATRVVAGSGDVQLSTSLGDIVVGVIEATDSVDLQTTEGDIVTGSITATSGSVYLEAVDGNVVLGEITAGTTVDIVADAGAITDLPDTTTDITAGDEIFLSALNDIGSLAANGRLELAAGSSVTAISANGNIALHGQAAITLQDLQAASGTVDVDAAGAISAVSVLGSTVVLATTSGGIVIDAISATDNVTVEAQSGDIETGDIASSDGAVSIQADDGDILIGTISADTSIDLTANSGAVHDTQETAVDLSAASINLLALNDIAGVGIGEEIELAAAAAVTASSSAGNIALRGLGSLNLASIVTGNGAISVTANGTIDAVDVDTSATDSIFNSITLVANGVGSDVRVASVTAGVSFGDVSITAQGNIIDADGDPDDLDISGNDIFLAATAGSVGGTSGDIFKGTFDAIEVVAGGNLTASALAGAVALDAQVGGLSTYAAQSLVLVSDGDLDVTGEDFSGVTNLALIADADRDSVGVLTLDSPLSVVGDLRLQGADIDGGVNPLVLRASRILVVSDASESLSVSNAFANSADLILDARGGAGLSVVTDGDIELLDLDCDNVALATTAAAGSVSLIASASILVSDDVIAGNDGLTTSIGSIVLQASSDLVINDTLLSDDGDIHLRAANDVLFGARYGLNDGGSGGAAVDDLLVVTTVNGNILITADSDGDANSAGGELSMSDDARLIAGRDIAVDYLPGIDELASPSSVVLGAIAKTVGQAEVLLIADEDIRLSSVQTANGTVNAIRATTSSGAIVDGGDSHTDIIANFSGALVTLRSVAGIGHTDALETAMNAVDAENSDALNIDSSTRIAATGDIVINEIAAGQSLNLVRAYNAAAGISDGDVRVVTDSGNLFVVAASFVPSNGLYGVETLAGSVLLQAAGDVEIHSSIQSQQHASIIAGDDVSVTASVTAVGDVLLTADNANSLDVFNGIDADASLASTAGTVLLRSNFDLRVSDATTAGIAIGLAAENDIFLDASLDAETGVLLAAGRDLTMTSLATVTAQETVVATADSTLRLGAITAPEIGLSAGGDILDANGAAINLTAQQTSLRAGGSIGSSDLGNLPQANAAAIDTDVAVLAAESFSGIYINEADDILIGLVDAISISASATRIALAGSGESADESAAVESLEDLTVFSEGVIKMVSTTGTITISDNDDNNSLGINLFSSDSVGDVLLQAAVDIVINAGILATSSNITLIAGDDIDVNDHVIATGTGTVNLYAGNVLRDTLLGVHMQASASIQTDNSDLRIAADNEGDIWLSSVDVGSGSVSLLAEGSIFDSNLTAQNVVADTLRMVGDAVINADGSQASFSGNGVGSIGSASAEIDIAVNVVTAQSATGIFLQEADDITIGASGDVSVARANFNSSRDMVIDPSRSDLVTTHGGTISLLSNAGSIRIEDGDDGDLNGIAAGQGSIRLLAAGSITAAPLVTDPAHTASVQGGHLTLLAGSFIHLPDTAVSTLEVAILLASNQQTENDFQNGAADAAGQAALATLGAAGLTPSRLDLSGSGMRFDELQQATSYASRFSDGYSLFVRNSGNLTLLSSELAMALDIYGVEPAAYIETTVGSNLTIAGTANLHSTTGSDPGIVLIAGQQLSIASDITLEVSGNAAQTQVVNTLALNAVPFDGGQLVPPVSTRLVIDNTAQNRLSGETIDSHIDQRVSMRFGSSGEVGFLTVIRFADGTYQLFDTAGDVAQTEANNFTLLPTVADSRPIAAADANAKLFARNSNSPFSPNFLFQNQMLPTDVVIRRSLDIFLFSGDEDGTYRDEAVFVGMTNGVVSGGGNLGFATIVEPQIPESPVVVVTTQSLMMTLPTPLEISQMELTTPTVNTVDVAIYRVEFNDLNQDGQVDPSELPTFDEVLEQELDSETREPIAPAKAGSTPTQEDIEREKTRLLRKPNQPSGAYAIIREDSNGERSVLDVFSVRDWSVDGSQNAELELPGDADLHIPSLPPFDPQGFDPQAPNEDQPAVPVAPSVREASPQESTDGEAAGQPAPAISRAASLGVLAGSIWMTRIGNQRQVCPPPQFANEQPPVDNDRDYSRKARRQRQLFRN